MMIQGPGSPRRLGLSFGVSFVKVVVACGSLLNHLIMCTHLPPSAGLEVCHHKRYCLRAYGCCIHVRAINIKLKIKLLKSTAHVHIYYQYMYVTVQSFQCSGHSAVRKPPAFLTIFSFQHLFVDAVLNSTGVRMCDGVSN